MKKTAFLTLVMVFVLLMSCFAAGEAVTEGETEENVFTEETPLQTSPELKKDVVVLFTSDVHCGVDQGFSYVGLKAVKDTAEAAGNHVLLTDNGDSVQGEAIGLLTRGMADIELMNDAGYDLAIPGNHEFDYGMDRFYELAGAADFPYISCNFRKNGELVFAPYIIREFDGVNIAFVGATTPETLTTSDPQAFQDEDGKYVYDFTQGGDGSDFYAAVQEAVDAARAEGAQYVFLISHLGNVDTSRPYTYVDVVENTTGIDAVLDGHSHDMDKVVMKNRSGREVIRQACGTKLAAVGWLKISCADGSIDTGLYTWDNDVSVPELLGIENEMSAPLENALSGIEDQLSEVIGHSSVEILSDDPVAKDELGRPLRIIRRAETSLGDFCADAFRQAAGADAALVMGGCIRSRVPRGDVTFGNMLEIFPFGNSVIMIKATGQQILDTLEWGVRAVPEENGAFCQVSGITYEVHTDIDSSCTSDENGMFTGVGGEYRVKNVMIGEKPLEPDKVYTVAGSGYSPVEHGDGVTAFDGAEVVWKSEKLDYEVIAAYIKDTLGGYVGEGYEDPYGEGRIVAVE